MAKKVQVPGEGSELHPATEVDVLESTERWSDIRLSDGTMLRAKVVVVSAARLDDQHGPDRNPIYHIKSQTIVSVVDAPEELKAKVQQ